MTAKRSMTYPAEHLLGVIDDPAAAASAASALVKAGLSSQAVSILRGTEGMERLGETEGVRGGWTKLLRSLQFITMDQMPDFPAYVAAIEDGRAVVAVKVKDREELARARDILVEADGHFLNYFGRYSTEEISRWRGAELPLPEYLRR